MALPHVAIVVGAVAHVVAVDVDEERVLGLVVDALADHAVAGDAGAHADLGTLLNAARDVGLGGRARVLAQHDVIGQRFLFAAVVIFDEADAGHLDVVAVPHEDAAALVAVLGEVAGVFRDGGAVDDVVVVAVVDAAALVLAGVLGDGAIADGGVFLIELDAAGVVFRVVARDDDVLDQAIVLARFLVDMDATSALVALGRGLSRLKRGVLRDRCGGGAVRRGDLKVGRIKVDAATGPRPVLGDRRVGIHVDRRLGFGGVHAAAVLGCVVVADR